MDAIGKGQDGVRRQPLGWDILTSPHVATYTGGRDGPGSSTVRREDLLLKVAIHEIGSPNTSMTTTQRIG